MKQNQFENALSSQTASERAVIRARKTLSLMGVHYPVYDPKLSAGEMHAALEAYGSREAALVIQYLKEPSGDRPLVEPKPLHRKVDKHPQNFLSGGYKHWADE